MGRGRRPMGPRQVDGLEGSTQSKQRLRAILETISGERSVPEVCQELGIKEAMFHRLKVEALEGAIAALEPKIVGRPRKEAAEKEGRVEELRAEVDDLKIKLAAAQVREELAATMPHVLKDAEKKRRRRV